jgi:hypothetical protein
LILNLASLAWCLLDGVARADARGKSDSVPTYLLAFPTQRRSPRTANTNNAVRKQTSTVLYIHRQHFPHIYLNNMDRLQQHQSSNDGKKLEIIKDISDRLEIGLNEDALQAITDLLRAGVHPDAVVAVVTSLNQHAH